MYPLAQIEFVNQVNFIISERPKKQEDKRIHASNYFWRTHTKQEVDRLAEHDGALFGYELKWSPKKVLNAPALWSKAHTEAKFEVIHPKNYLDFVVEYERVCVSSPT